MPSFCAVRNCELKYNKTENVSFHKFPQYNIELRKKWIEFTGRENWEPSRWSALCSRHFRTEDFKTKSLAKNSSRMSLKSNAYPIIVTKNSKETNSDASKIINPSKNNPSNASKLNSVETSKSQEVKVQNNNIKIESVIPVSVNNYQKSFIAQSKEFLPSTIFTTIHSCLNNSSDELFRGEIDFNAEQNSNSITLNQLNTINSLDISSTSNDNQKIQENSVTQECGNLTNRENQNCRLCSNRIDPSDSAVSFSTDFQIFGMLQKCFPTLNMQQEDNYPKNICSFCLEKLDDFSDFIDLVIESQKHFDQRFQKLPTRNERIKIKQEPNLRIKQEALENTTFAQTEINSGEKKSENHNRDDEQLSVNQHSNSTNFDEIEQKSHFYDLPVLDAKDMDIMEIISLDDAFIDIDEMTNDAGNLSDSDLLNITNSLKSIENGETKKNINNMANNPTSKNIDADDSTNNNPDINIQKENIQNDKIDLQKQSSNYSDVDLQNIFSKCSKLHSNNYLKNESFPSDENNDSEIPVLKNKHLENVETPLLSNTTENLKNDSISHSIDLVNFQEKSLNEFDLDLTEKKENLSSVGNKEEDIKHFSDSDNQNFYDPLHEHNYTKYYGEQNYKTEQPEYETEDLEENLAEEEIISSRDIVDLTNEDVKPISESFEKTENNKNNQIKKFSVAESQVDANTKIVIENSHRIEFDEKNNFLHNSNYDALSELCVSFPISNSAIYPENFTTDLSRSISSLNSTNLNPNNRLTSSVINIGQNLYSNFINKSPNNNPKQSIVVLNESILKPSFNLLNNKRDCSLPNNENENLLEQSKNIQSPYKPSIICTYLCEFCNFNFDSFFELLNHRNICELKNSTEKSELLNICDDDNGFYQSKEIKIEESVSIGKSIHNNEVNCDQVQETAVIKTTSDNVLEERAVTDSNAGYNTEKLIKTPRSKSSEVHTISNSTKTNTTAGNAIYPKNISESNNVQKVVRRKTNSLPIIKPIKILCKMCRKQFETKVALNNHKKYLCTYKRKSDGFNCKYCNYNLRKWIECRQHEKKCKLSFRKKNRRNLRIHKSKGISLNEPPKILENIQMLKPNVNYKRFNNNKQPEPANKIQNKISNGPLNFANQVSQSNETLSIPSNLNSIQSNVKSIFGSNSQLLNVSIDQKYSTQNIQNSSIVENTKKVDPSKTISDKIVNNNVHFKCVNCSKFFITEEFLIKHQADCLKGIVDQTVLLTKHQKQLFNCEKCNKQFKAIKNLMQHKITHSNVRNYQCHLCKDKFFKRSNGLNQHIKNVHQGLKPYNCPICNHFYALKGDAMRCRHSSLKI